MNNVKYNFTNTGYKIHIPCVNSTEDPLTRRIADFLDSKFGLKTNTAKQYQAGFYKVGCGGDTLDGTGITLYGRTESMAEMQNYKQFVPLFEKKFGKSNSLLKYLGNYNDNPRFKVDWLKVAGHKVPEVKIEQSMFNLENYI